MPDCEWLTVLFLIRHWEKSTRAAAAVYLRPFLLACSLYYRPLVNFRKADYTQGDRMVETWAWLSAAWIMMGA